MVKFPQITFKITREPCLKVDELYDFMSKHAFAFGKYFPGYFLPFSELCNRHRGVVTVKVLSPSSGPGLWCMVCTWITLVKPISPAFFRTNLKMFGMGEGASINHYFYISSHFFFPANH